MKAPMKERWMELCEQAANEPDPQRLMQLISEINQLLAEREDRIHHTKQAEGFPPEPSNRH